MATNASSSSPSSQSSPSMNQAGPSSYHQSLEDQEESVRIAVRALGDMRSGGGAAGTSNTAQRRSSSSRHAYDDEDDRQRERGYPSTSRSDYDYDDHDTSSRSPRSSSYATAPTHVSRTTSATSSGVSAPAAATNSNTNGTGTVNGGGGLVSRMSHFPLVGSALRVYEQGKASSRVVKYGAEMVESSVKSISKPVIDRLPVNVDRLDEFACRQLDRLDRYRRPSTTDTPSTSTSITTSQITATTPSTSNVRSSSSSSRNIKQEEEEGSDHEMAIDGRRRSRDISVHALNQVYDHEPRQSRSRSRVRNKDGYEPLKVEEEEEEEDVDMDAEIEGSPIITRREWVVREGPSSDIVLRGGPGSVHGSGRAGRVPSWLEATSPFVVPPPPPLEDSQSRSRSDTRGNRGSRSSTPTQASNNGYTNGSTHEGQVAQRSRWQAVLLEAGGLSAALSEESMRRLKYCLQWLQYATAHIDAQILILRDFTASLQPFPGHPSSSHPSQPRPPISPEQLRKLTAVRRDLVHTIRQVVDVVSKYAGASLPEPARKRVRGFILKLPQRWANVAKQKAGFAVPGGGADSIDMGDIGAGSSSERQDRGESSSSTVAAAAGVVRRPGGQRRAAHRERGVDAPGPGYRSGPSSRATSPVRGGPASAGSGSSPRATRAALDREREDGSGSIQGPGAPVSASTAMVAAQRILALATESLDMMRGVTGVVKDSLDRAETWVGRLRTVGIQRGTDGTAIPEGAIPPGFEGFNGSDTAMHARDEHDRDRTDFDFEFSDRMRYRHTRNASDNSNYDDIDSRDRDRESPTPPSFFSTASSSGSTWASSVPGTPASSGGPVTSSSSYPSFGGYHHPSSLNNNVNTSSGYGQSQSQGYPSYGSPRAPQSPLAIPLGAMSLGSAANSRYGSRSGSLNGTPRSVIVGLPEEEEEDLEDRRRVLPSMKEMLERTPVKVVHPDEDVVGMVDVGRERMDVDANA